MTRKRETPAPRRPAWVEAWIAPLIERAHFRVDDMDLADSRAWKLSGGAIRHVSGLFFAVTGVEWRGVGGTRISQPLIEQREIGTLGFVMRAGAGGNELLVQAKMEPGNVGAVQLAPTCQATASNAARVHGGEAPPFSTLFVLPGRDAPLHESLQSEQGSRFLGKRNRNVLLRDPGGIEAGPAHRWLPVDDVLALVAEDFLLNTDARSVLVSSPWETLTGRPPFSRHASGFGAELALSHAQRCDPATLAPIRDTLERLRSAARPPRTVDLAELHGWRLDRSGLAPVRGGAYRFRHIQVDALGREVPRWDQPIISSCGPGRIDLVCGRIGGVLHFLFSAQVEPGLPDLVELGPSRVREPGAQGWPEDDDPPRGRIVARTSQSEEGGRFYLDINEYRILDAGEAYAPAPGSRWLTLAQICALLREGGWFTNEARCALSLLLAWL